MTAEEESTNRACGIFALRRQVAETRKDYENVKARLWALEDRLQELELGRSSDDRSKE